jgi:hypothetical protein
MQPRWQSASMIGVANSAVASVCMYRSCHSSLASSRTAPIRRVMAPSLGRMPTTSARLLTSFIQAFERVRRVHLRPVPGGEVHVGQHVGLAVVDEGRRASTTSGRSWPATWREVCAAPAQSGRMNPWPRAELVWKDKVRASMREQYLNDGIENFDFHIARRQECRKLSLLILRGDYAPEKAQRILVESKGLCRQLVIPSARELWFCSVCLMRSIRKSATRHRRDEPSSSRRITPFRSRERFPAETFTVRLLRG